MNDLKNSFEEIVKKRRSVRVFDSSLPFDKDAVLRSLQRAILSPNSSNMQLWKFYRIQSHNALKKMEGICLNQMSVKTAKELVVFVCPLSDWQSRCDFNLEAFTPKDGKTFKDAAQKKVYDYYKKLIPSLYKNDSLGLLGVLRKIYITCIGFRKPTYREVLKSDLRVIAHKSCALAAQTFMLSIASEGLASCPLEGFDSKRLSRFLKLPKGYEINMVVALGPEDKKGIFGEQRRIPLSQICTQL